MDIRRIKPEAWPWYQPAMIIMSVALHMMKRWFENLMIVKVSKMKSNLLPLKFFLYLHRYEYMAIYLLNQIGKTLSFYKVRPRFEWKTEESAQAILARLNRHKQQNNDVVMSGIDTHFTLTVRDDLQRIWSPYCQLNMEHNEDGTLSVHGLYGPNPNVWTIFIFGYSLLILLAFFISIIGFSQYSLGMDARILWVLPVCIGTMTALFIAGLIGRKWGEDQTQLIHRFIEESLEAEIHLSV